ncbi:MAG TPA: hypothetical protein VD866_15445 [Urbifossiella sp.]|nr:hypothetical protein [Urbifossiella sp.]
MKSSLFALAVAVAVAAAGPAVSQPPPAKQEKAEPLNASKGVEVKLADFETLTLKTDKVTVNNFVINQSDEGQFRVNALVRAQGTRNFSCTMMMVGFDDKKGIVWTTKISTYADPKGLSLFQDNSSLPDGSLQKTATVWVRILESDRGF